MLNISKFTPRILTAAIISAMVLSGCTNSSTPNADNSANSASKTPAITASVEQRSGTTALIPLPAKMEMLTGEFIFSNSTTLTANNAEAQTVADQFSQLLTKTSPWQLKSSISEKLPETGVIFSIDPNFNNTIISKNHSDNSNEAYQLDINDKQIKITAKNIQGLFYGATTLWQLIGSQPATQVKLSGMTIQDAPRFKWRGFMLDSVRHLQTVDQIKAIIDTMATNKFNTFHWHLSDDQGWRIEIKKYPKLTEIGGCRIPAGDAGIDSATGNPKPYCGFYTQDQVRDIVAYAAAKHIQVIPEIDIPGHAQAAVAAYPEFGSVEGQAVVSPDWGVAPYLFNPDEKTLTFLEDVFSEMMPLFPAEYIHVGGDEAIKDQWKASPTIQAKIKELGLKNEEELQSFMLKRLEKFFVQHNKKLIGWDEIVEGGLPPEAAVMAWRKWSGVDGGLEAAKQGHDVVMAPAGVVYLNFLQTNSPNEVSGQIANSTMEMAYNYDPIPKELSADKHHHILGVQANTWTEHLRTIEYLHHSMFPRAAAVAEVAWSPVEKRDFKNFITRLPEQLQRYRAMGLYFAPTPFEVSKTVEENKDNTLKVSLSNSTGYSDIRYTTDGSMPTASSTAYSEPLNVTIPTQLNAAVFFEGQPLVNANLWNLDNTFFTERNNANLSLCGNELKLRMEDDTEIDGKRAIFSVSAMDPCWQWDNARLTNIASVEVRAAQVPFNFQLAHDEKNRKFKPAKAQFGELEISATCKGPVIATVPLPAKTENGFTTLSMPLTSAITGNKDLCIRFTGDTRPMMWVVDSVKLVAKP